jgi:hypothetical protein
MHCKQILKLLKSLWRNRAHPSHSTEQFKQNLSKPYGRLSEMAHQAYANNKPEINANKSLKKGKIKYT